jgi:hypothetical protein
MPARMWRHGIHSFLEPLRHRLPASLDHMLAFIYFAYTMIALVYETVPASKMPGSSVLVIWVLGRFVGSYVSIRLFCIYDDGSAVRDSMERVIDKPFQPRNFQTSSTWGPHGQWVFSRHSFWSDTISYRDVVRPAVSIRRILVWYIQDQRHQFTPHTIHIFPYTLRNGSTPRYIHTIPCFSYFRHLNYDKIAFPWYWTSLTSSHYDEEQFSHARTN